jgi:hypothetical protein
LSGFFQPRRRENSWKRSWLAPVADGLEKDKKEGVSLEEEGGDADDDGLHLYIANVQGNIGARDYIQAHGLCEIGCLVLIGSHLFDQAHGAKVTHKSC